MKGLRRVVVGSAVGGLLGAAAFFAVDGLMPSTVDAAPTHLKCEDTTSTWNGSPYRMFTRHIFFNLDTKRATVDGDEKHLKATPDELRIYRQGKNENGKLTSYMLKVNRSTLAYDFEYAFLSSGSEFIGKGQCQITKAPAGNTI